MTKSAALCAGLLVWAATPAQAEDREWKVEITPYVWFAGIDGDITGGGQTAHIDLSFSDLFDVVDMGGMALGVIQYVQWVALAQFDYVSMDTDRLEPAPAGGRLESDFFGASLAAGYQWEAPRTTIDVLLGARIVHLTNDLTVTGMGSFSKSNTLVDPALFLRPSMSITSWLRFNPTLGIGGLGSSDLIYELSPQFQFQFTEHLAARVGYRRVYYKYDRDGVEFDGAMSGFMVGLGVMF